MAKWDRLNDRGNVEDRRASRVTSAVGGISVTGILLILAVGYFGGQDQALQLAGEMLKNPPRQEVSTTKYDGQDSYEVFSSTVLGSTDTLWTKVFKQYGKSYAKPRLVLFRGATQSACGGALSQVGPHYCSLDKTIYLDERFFEEMKQKFGAIGGDVAEGYVIAHEVGHHIQNELGILNQAQNLMRKNPRAKNTYSIALELQADCLAGVWAGTIDGKGILEKNEIMEAIDAASKVGDDHIQVSINGQIHPESWTHGSSADRQKWFLHGFQKQDINACDTFSRL